MPLQNDDASSLIVKKTVWLLAAVAINAIEFFVPRLPFFPWLKPGLANIVTILWIVEFGGIDAVLYSLLRSWIVGFYFGFSFLTMSLSLCGGVLATVAMAVAWRVTGKNRLLGTVGLGIIGALFHNLGQLLAVYALMSENMHLFYQVPVMLAASVVFGGIVGRLAPFAYRIFQAVPVPLASRPAPSARFSATPSERFFSVLLLASCVAIAFADSAAVLVSSAAAATLITQIVKKGSVSEFFKPLSRFWVLFAFIALIDVFFSYGTRIESIPFVTREGLEATARQWLRLWTWLQVSAILSFFKFDAVMLEGMARLFKNHHETLSAGVLALEYFPGIADDGRAYVKRRIADIFSKKRRIDGGTKKKDGDAGLDGWAKGLYGVVARRMEEESRKNKNVSEVMSR
jgi:heptaprenyl diphosphate synthase